MSFNLLYTLGAFILALGILITFHEFGHYLVARLCGVKILRFSIGFGRPLLSRKVGPDKTEFIVAALPLGGYVKMLDEREGQVAAHELSRAFTQKSLAARSAIVIAGPAFNFFLAVAVYAATYLIGVTGTKPIIGTVTPTSVAADAGLQSDDVIIEINDRQTPTWEAALNSMLASVVDGKSINLTVRREHGTARLQLDSGDTVDIDKVGRGELFSELGFEPKRLFLPAVVGEVREGEAGARAGMIAGDRILAIDGEEIVDWYGFRERVQQSPEKPLTLLVRRNGEKVQINLTPESVAVGGSGGVRGFIRSFSKEDEDARAKEVGRAGVAVEPPPRAAREALLGLERYGPLESLRQGLRRTVEMSVLTLKILKKMLVGEASVKNISGPLSIAHFAGESASLGLVPFLSFLALVSVSLGVLNLLPIPILDGGHLVYYLIEFIFGKPASRWVEGYAQQLGLVLLFSLMGLAIYNDISRLVLNG